MPRPPQRPTSVVPIHQRGGNPISRDAGKVGGAMTRDWHANAAPEQRAAVTETRRLKYQMRNGKLADGPEFDAARARYEELLPLTKVKGS